MMLKNNLFLKALRGDSVKRPPVWMMRQAGRYLPDFIKLRNKYDFFTRCRTPELATEITLMPIDQIGTDAAILFSDILVVPQAMGVEIDMKPNFGPWLPDPIRSKKDVDRVIRPCIDDTLGYVMEAIKMTKEELNDRVPLIGFAGAPWTIFCYLVEGQGSRKYDKAKALCYTNSALAHKLLKKITDTTIDYLKAKALAGVDAVQIFDSWAGILSPVDYQEFSWYYNNQIIESLYDTIPVIAFAKGCWFALDQMSKSKVSAIGIDWTISPQKAREFTGGTITLQGNFDPSRLLSPIKTIEKMVKEMIDAFGKDKYIVNLGHGILPNIPLSHARAFVETVKNYS